VEVLGVAGGNEEVWRVTDPLGYDVVLTKRRWAHILERRRFIARLQENSA